MIGQYTEIQHFSLNDGPGIRTILFLKGCPLHCSWCHNPETQSIHTEISYYHHRCLGCGACVQICPRQCHKMTGGIHSFSRENCINCGACVRVCPTALDVCGREIDDTQATQLLMADRPFYDISGGGVTISGGEPLLQASFCAAVLGRCRQVDVHTCIETSCFAPWEAFAQLLPVTNLFLCDWKLSDDSLHRAYTGVSNMLIYENLVRLNEAGAAIWLRCPIIPGINDSTSHFHQIAALANDLHGIERVELMPYHDIWRAKSQAFGFAEKPVFSVPTEEQIDNWICELKRLTKKGVTRG